MENIKRPAEIAFASLLIITAAVLALFYPVMSYGQIPPYHQKKMEYGKIVQYAESKKTVVLPQQGNLTAKKY